MTPPSAPPPPPSDHGDTPRSSASRQAEITSLRRKEAEDELASTARVRNRLAASSDATLPRILAGLLPRVLSRVARFDPLLEGRLIAASTSAVDGGANDGADDDVDVDAELTARKGANAALRGVVRHAEERVRGDPAADVPWMEAVADFVASAAREEGGPNILMPPMKNNERDNMDDDDDERRWQSRGRRRAIGLGLGLLNAGLARCGGEARQGCDEATRERRVRAALAAALAVVEVLHLAPSTGRDERGDGVGVGNDGDEHEEGGEIAPLRRPRPAPPRPLRRVGPAPVGLVPADRLGRAAGMEAEAVLHEDHARRRATQEEDDDEEMAEAGGNRESGGDDPRSDAAWLALDCIALLAGTRPLSDDFDAAAAGGGGAASSCSATTAGSSASLDAIKSLVRPEEVDAVSISHAVPSAPSAGEGPREPPSGGETRGAGDGTFDLLLDLVLYWPGRGICGGISAGGFRRMERRVGRLGSSDLGVGDLVELKLAALRYAVWPPGRGIFDGSARAIGDRTGDGCADDSPPGDDDVGASRAVLLLLLACGHPVGGAGFAGGSKSGASEGVHRAKLGRVAGGRLARYLDRYHVGTSALPVSAVLRSFGVSPASQKKKKKKKLSSSAAARRAGPHLGTGLAYSLLILILGEEGAAPVLADYPPSLGRRWREVLGRNVPPGAAAGPTGGDGAETARDGGGAVLRRTSLRVPLPARLSAAALDFVTRHFLDEEARLASSCGGRSSSPEETGLLARLALPAAERALRNGIEDDDLRRALVLRHGWGNLPVAGAAALGAVCAGASGGATDEVSESAKGNGSRIPWQSEARSRCLAIAMSALLTVPATTEDAPLDDIDGMGENIMPELIPHRMRGRIAAQMRARRARNVLLPPTAVRKTLYEVMGKLAPDAVVAKGSILEGGSLDGSVLLLRCVVMEEETMRPEVAAALESHLRAFQSHLHRPAPDDDRPPRMPSSEEESHLQAVAAPLLPPLLSAACSESRVARLSCARWASGVLPLLDPLSAVHLCAYLADDPDAHTARAARECIAAITSSDAEPGVKRRRTSSVSRAISGHETGRSGKAVAIFLDSEGGMGRQVLYTKLDQEVSSLAQQLGVEDRVAFVLMRCHDYSGEKALISYQSNPSETLELCGVKHRCKTSSTAVGDSSVDAESHTCGICFDENLTAELLFSMPCGHAFCRECWCSYLRVEFEGSILDAVCPQEDCCERVTDAEIADLLPSMLDAWTERSFAAFVERNARYRFCPGPNCPMIAICEAMGSDNLPVTASCEMCNTCFCFGCGELPHAPSSCESVRQWRTIFTSNDFWITKNSKPCPQCHVPIEKVVGCNHMHCTRCDCHFCWLCLTVIGAEGILNNHVCNRYDPSKEGGEEGRNVFYVTRFEAHDEGETFARARLRDMADKTKQMSEEPLLLSEVESRTVNRAGEVLVESRRFLKFSYIVAFCMPDAPPQTPETLGKNDEQVTSPLTQTSAKDVFVAHQGTLEKFTERLSALTEVDLENLADLKGDRVLRMHLRSIDFHSQCVSQYMKRVVRSHDDMCA